MTQAIKLPEHIVGQHKSHDNIPQLIEEIKNYAREVALVAIILSDNHLSTLYDKMDIVYIATIDMIHEWADEFVRTYAHVEEWEEFIYSDKNPYSHNSVACWDDFVIRFGTEKINSL